MTTIVTSGDAYFDIDAFAGCIAYAELLRQNSHPAVAVIAGLVNESVPPSARRLDVPYVSTYELNAKDDFVLIDISEPKFFAQFVDHKRILEIIDHHPGFEQYWQERNISADIETIGAACTLVVERWIASGRQDKMPRDMATLLGYGILDNTLNLKAHITTDRDKRAYDSLGMPTNAPSDYFSECEQQIIGDLTAALSDGTKMAVLYPGFADAMSVGQLAVWNARKLLVQHKQTIDAYLDKSSYLNLIDISEGRSYFVSSHKLVKDFLYEMLDVEFDGDIARADRPWLRKEIMKKAMNVHGVQSL